MPTTTSGRSRRKRAMSVRRSDRRRGRCVSTSKRPMTPSSSEETQASHPAATILGPAMPNTWTFGARSRSAAISAAPSVSPDASPATTPTRTAGALPDQAAFGAPDEFHERCDFGLRLAELGQARDGFGQQQVRAVQHAKGVLDVANLIRREAATREPHGVHGSRLRRIAGHHHVRRYVARDDGATRNECMRADFAELVDRRHSTDGDPITDLNVAAERCAVGEHEVAADHAVVGDVRIRHEEIVVADRRDALVVRRAAVDRARLTEDVAVTDLEARWLALVLLVLRRIAERGELMDAVFRAHARRPVDDHVRADDRARPDHDIRPDDGERTHGDIGRELRFRRHDGTRIDHDAPAAGPVPLFSRWPLSGATIISACATSLSSTRATVENFQMPLNARSSVAVRTSWSPGSTGFRKRALSMPTK